jgi:hypothetical protein
LALVGYVRRWRNGTLHWELARLQRYSSTAEWEPDSVSGSSLEGQGLHRPETTPGGEPVEILEHTLVLEEKDEEVIDAFRQLMGRAAWGVSQVRLNTGVESVSAEVRSPYGFFVLLGRERHPPEPPELVAVRGFGDSWSRVLVPPDWRPPRHADPPTTAQ